MNRNESIDFIKGIAILLVILFHCIGRCSSEIAGILSIEQGVPLFLIVSSYLYFKAQENKPLTFYKKRNFIKLFHRIFVPFFIFQILLLFISYLRNDIGISVITRGGIGLGSYYPWLYFQFWLLLPCFSYLIKHLKIKAWHAVIISIAVEIIFNQIASINLLNQYAGMAWRLFVGRYVFIIYIGFLIAENKFNYKKLAPITLIGVTISLLERYDIWNLSLLYYIPESLAWKGFHWHLYFYSASLFILLRFLFTRSPKWVKHILNRMGRYSWEIFLSQMLYFHLFNFIHFRFSNLYVSIISYIVFSIIISVIIAILYIKLKEFINVKRLNKSLVNKRID